MDIHGARGKGVATGSVTSHPAEAPAPAPGTSGTAKKKRHRGGKKKKSRRKSFAHPLDDPTADNQSEGLGETRDNFYLRGHNLSNTSLDSENLLDHRDQPFLRARRPSLLTPTGVTSRPSFPTPSTSTPKKRAVIAEDVPEDEERNPWDEAAPLLSSPGQSRKETSGYGSLERSGQQSPGHSSVNSGKKKLQSAFAGSMGEGYKVNYPPSIPGTPPQRPLDRSDMSFGDIMLRDGLEAGQMSPQARSDPGDEGERGPDMFKPSPLDRRHTIAQEDVCFPQEGLSEIADDEAHGPEVPEHRMRNRTRRRGKWPDLSILDEWSQFEEEGRKEKRRAKKITEPQLINGRLRPVGRKWYRAEDEAPYRFTYFNEEFPSTIHSHTISELVQPGGSFRELFVPDRPVLSDSSSDEEDDEDVTHAAALRQVMGGLNGDSKVPSRQPSLIATQALLEERRERIVSPSGLGKISDGSKHSSGSQSPLDTTSPRTKSPLKSPLPAMDAKPVRYGDRPVWWLDILSPTEAEMKVISKAFGIHPLTAEDIMVQEQREKVELFRHYYFVNYRSFDQDQSSNNFLEPVNMYVVVFREGVLSFHFSATPHPANVRRRIRQLSDYLILSSDWISYAIIDDITDTFGPLIQNIEDEVDDIDDAILQLHSPDNESNKGDEKKPEEPGNGGDMLRRVGDCRKKVMLLYRLLGNKADVIKGFAKRCNEHWEVAPRSEIGLYLGDIQDHIVTMTANLSHYEKILARSHGNYLAQINILMNERQEQTADVLGKLTVLGTIVLPMNVITGLWGMNVWVPGQSYEGDLTWFWALSGGLIVFGIMCYLIAKRVYKIV